MTVAPIAGGWQVGGEIDANTAPALADVLSTHRPDISRRELVIDVSGVDFMDSSGLDVLLDVRGRLAVNGGLLVLRQPSRCVVRLLEVARMRSAFPVERSRVSCRHRPRRRVQIQRRRPSRR